MKLGDLLRKSKMPIRLDTIIATSTSGHHLLSSGKMATVVTDEPMHAGNQVIVVTSDRNRDYILGTNK